MGKTILPNLKDCCKKTNLMLSAVSPTQGIAHHILCIVSIIVGLLKALAWRLVCRELCWLLS